MQIVAQSTCKINYFFHIKGKFKGSPHGKT